MAGEGKWDQFDDYDDEVKRRRFAYDTEGQPLLCKVTCFSLRR